MSSPWCVSICPILWVEHGFNMVEVCVQTQFPAPALGTRESHRNLDVQTQALVVSCGHITSTSDGCTVLCYCNRNCCRFNPCCSALFLSEGERSCFHLHFCGNYYSQLNHRRQCYGGTLPPHGGPYFAPSFLRSAAIQVSWSTLALTSCCNYKCKASVLDKDQCLLGSSPSNSRGYLWSWYLPPAHSQHHKKPEQHQPCKEEEILPLLDCSKWCWLLSRTTSANDKQRWWKIQWGKHCEKAARISINTTWCQDLPGQVFSTCFPMQLEDALAGVQQPSEQTAFDAEKWKL